MSEKRKPIANPSIVFRDDFDDWAVLFDPDTGDTFGLNPVGVFLWQRLDGKHTVENIAAELRADCEDVPEKVGDDLLELIEELVGSGLAGYETE